jgi:hypothetical protein
MTGCVKSAKRKIFPKEIVVLNAKQVKQMRVS